MKPYKKYGDFYAISKQVRSNLKTNGFHGSRKGLYRFWYDQAEECFRQGRLDSMYAYISMVALARVLDTQKPDKGVIFCWGMFVIAFRLSYK